MALNDHILEAPDGSSDVKFKLTGLKGAKISGGGSGHVTPGNYKLLIKKATFEKKKDKPGKNIKVEAAIVEPAAFAGVPIVVYIPAPQGEAIDTGMQTLRNIMISSASFKGTLDTLLSTEDLDMSPGSLVNRTIAARVTDGTGQYANRSQIDGYLEKDDYEKAPGPQAGLVASAASKAQTNVPNVPANGTATSATKAAVDNALADV